MRVNILMVLMLAAGGMRGDDLRIRVTAHPLAEGCVNAATVVAVADGGTRRTEAVRSAPGEFVLALRDTQARKLRAEAPGCWGETRPWDPASGNDVTLRLFRLTHVEAPFENTAGAIPSPIRGTLFLPATPRAHDGEPDAALGSETSCAVADGRWRCTAPAEIPFDLRLEVPGYAALQYWSLLAHAGESRELEPQPLRAGGRLAGWVQAQKEVPLSHARVSMFPLAQPNAGGRTDARPASRWTTRTDRKGYFQIDGLPPGRYRLVSEAAGVSPAVLPEVEVRPGTEFTLPRPVRHDPFGEAEVVLDPAADPKGEPWTVELREAVPLYPGTPAAARTRTADQSGRVRAAGLRADLYEVSVRDSTGSVVHHAELDLFGGGHRVLQLSVRPVVLRGRITAGGEPLAAELQLAGDAREYVTLTAGENGTFETTLPRKGTWSATVLYPRGRTAARIKVPPVTIPDSVPAGGAHEVTIELAGGRVYGEVTERGGRRVRGAVYLRRNGQLEAQQLTTDEGTFDIVGLQRGEYLVEAQTANGGTARPLEITIDESDSREVTVVTEPYVRFAGQVLTPDGRPASGAIVKYSPDGGAHWTEAIADIHGHFERRINGAVDSVPVVVLTYDYPAAILRVRAGEPLRIQLRSDGGIVRFDRRPPPFVSARGVTANAFLFHFPPPQGRFGGGVFLEAGAYTICPRRDTTSGCRAVTVHPGSEQTLTFEQENRSGETS